MSQPQTANACAFELPADRSATAVGPAVPADIASLRALFAPESVAVIGAGRNRGTVGRAILDNIRGGGFRGRVYAVNPRLRQIDGDRCLPSALDLPEPVDLAVIAVPAASVVGVAEECGRRGVRALVVITSEIGTAASANLIAVCRRHGMRLVGPNCFGVAVPGIGLDATFAASHPQPGTTGLIMQSGGLGLAAMERLSRLGIGISSFASVGDKLDVSGNDLLKWWEQDGDTRLAVLYIESFGNPRTFARTARRLGRAMPVLTVHPGRSALFEQAGIIAVQGIGELVELAALLATQPAPAGRTVAIISNAGSAGVLVADAAAGLGLVIHRPRGLTRRRLHALLPDGGAVDGPVDTTAEVSGETFRQCLELLAADHDVDAIIAVIMPTGATGDLAAAAQAADINLPIAAVVLDQPESVRLLPRIESNAETTDTATGRAQPDLPGRLPVYGYPEAAARAVACAVRYGAWRAEPPGREPAFRDLRTGAAGTLVRDFARRAPGGGWLDPSETAELLGCYGISIAGLTPLTGGTEVTITSTDDHLFGPLMALRLDETGTESRPGPDLAPRLAPLTDADADKLIQSVSSAVSRLGDEGATAACIGPLRDVLLRVSRLAEDLTEITDLELNLVINRQGAVVAVDARIKVAPHEPHDAFLRGLR
jgi:acyl-CoA synthetase (NDP forming)